MAGFYRSWLQGWLLFISCCVRTYAGSGKMTIRKRSDKRRRLSSLYSQVRIHFAPRQEVVLACDPSSYGVEAVLLRRLIDGTERPIAFASISLAEAERRYAQLDREALAFPFGVTKSHQCLSERALTILTDHKPLVSQLGENKGVPWMASGRMQRWTIMLSGYHKLRYRQGTTKANADVLSRFPLPVKPELTIDETPVNWCYHCTSWK